MEPGFRLRVYARLCSPARSSFRLEPVSPRVAAEYLYPAIEGLSRIEALSGESADTSGVIVSPAPAREAFRRSFALSEREMEVMEGLCDGLSNKSLAANLFISERTVKAHVASIFRKTGSTTRTEVIALGYRAMRG